jgi:putative flavoprotein involved in K+ transport
MSLERVDVLIVGGGQAGLAMSYCLTGQGRSHVVLEQGRIAESWRSRRWDSLRLIAPNWSLELPGYTYHGDDPEGYMGKDEVAAHLEAYAHAFAAPVQEGVRVAAIARDAAGGAFFVETEAGTYEAAQVVLATGALQRPRLPAWAVELPAAITQMSPYDYRNPRRLPPGVVLVVGSGQTGCQIAEELVRAGREVSLAMSRSWWLPRRYRGRNASAWLRSLGWMKRTVDELPPGARTGLANPQLSGGGGGHDINAHTLAREGVRLLGRVQGVRDGTLTLSPDLAANVAWGDEQARTFLRAVDEYIRIQGLEAPAEDWPRDLEATAELAQQPAAELDLVASGVSTVIWATGYRPDLDWVGLPFLDAEGYPIQRRGVTSVPGLYILGLDWLYTAGSGIFSGLADDAFYLAAQMAEHAAGSGSGFTQRVAAPQ